LLQRAVLRGFDLAAPILRRAGVDYPQFRAILGLKLTLDRKRPRPAWGTREGPGKRLDPFVVNLILYSAFGFVPVGVIASAGSPLVAFTVVHSFVLVMVGLGLVSDFSSVLLETRDQQILGARPVAPKTLLAARLAHIVVYLALLSGSLAAGSLIVIAVRYGVVALLLPLTLALGNVLVLAATGALYLLVMRYFDQERVRDVIVYVQIVVVMTWMFGYQILPRLIDMKALATTDIAGRWWTYLYPPAWLAGLLDLATGRSGPPQWILATLALVGPAVAFVALDRLGPSFRVAPVAAHRRRPRKPRRVVFHQRLAALFRRWPATRAGFELTWQLCAGDRQFKLRTYPAMAMIFIFGFVALRPNQGLEELVASLAQSVRYLPLLYLSAILAPAAISEARNSETPAAAWIYWSAPIARPGALLAGALMAVLMQLVMPAFGLLAAVCLAIWGLNVLADVVLAAGVTWLTSVLFAWWEERYFPFSCPVSVRQTSGRLGRLVLLALVPLLAGFIHWGLTFVPWGVHAAMLPVYGAALLLTVAYARTDWRSMRA